MNKLARLSAMLSALILLSSISNGVRAEEACGDGGGGSKDIQSLSASFDAGSGAITVGMTLCAPPDNQTKYRVRYDHTPPFAPDADRNGDTLINADDFCVPTSDTGMMHQGNKDTGPGHIGISGPVLTYTVNMAELNPALVIGDSVLLWADTQNKGIKDRVPDTDAGNGCDEPEVAGEFITLLLSDAIIYAIGGDGPAGGKVFRITEGGLHGLEAAPEDQSTAAWCSSFIDIDGVDNIVNVATPDNHSGSENTLLIAAVCGPGSAAGVASAYVWPNGQTDGFLPNKEELNLLFGQKDVVGGFASGNYWSSSEFDDGIAWGQFFLNGNQSIFFKPSALRVRAVRAF